MPLSTFTDLCRNFESSVVEWSSSWFVAVFFFFFAVCAECFKEQYEFCYEAIADELDDLVQRVKKKRSDAASPNSKPNPTPAIKISSEAGRSRTPDRKSETPSKQREKRPKTSETKTIEPKTSEPKTVDKTKPSSLDAKKRRSKSSSPSEKPPINSPLVPVNELPTISEQTEKQQTQEKQLTPKPSISEELSSSHSASQ